jgi:hypothetical protein
MKNTGASSIVCFTILVLPVLLDEEYWSFQYCVINNTSIISIVGLRILEPPVLCIDQRFWGHTFLDVRPTAQVAICKMPSNWKISVT